MWFALGVFVGYFVHKLFSWMDVAVTKRVESSPFEEECYSDVPPRGTPISFDEWKKENGIR